MFPPSFGSWAAPIQMFTRKPRKRVELNELPVNHSPLFAPVIHPTLRTGVETLVVAAQAWFSAQRPLH